MSNAKIPIPNQYQISNVQNDEKRTVLCFAPSNVGGIGPEAGRLLPVRHLDFI
jgi:hypothetical protein